MEAYDPDANIVAQLGELNLSQDLLFPDVVVLSEQVDDLSIEIALQWTKGVTEQICSYANGSPTTQGGMHVEGFSKALTEVVKAHTSPVDSLIQPASLYWVGTSGRVSGPSSGCVVTTPALSQSTTTASTVAGWAASESGSSSTGPLASICPPGWMNIQPKRP